MNENTLCYFGSILTIRTSCRLRHSVPTDVYTRKLRAHLNHRHSWKMNRMTEHHLGSLNIRVWNTSHGLKQTVIANISFHLITQSIPQCARD